MSVDFCICHRFGKKCPTHIPITLTPPLEITDKEDNGN